MIGKGIVRVDFLQFGHCAMRCLDLTKMAERGSKQRA